jgi:hypothetical protein
MCLVLPATAVAVTPADDPQIMVRSPLASTKLEPGIKARSDKTDMLAIAQFDKLFSQVLAYRPGLVLRAEYVARRGVWISLSSPSVRRPSR